MNTSMFGVQMLRFDDDLFELFHTHVVTIECDHMKQCRCCVTEFIVNHCRHTFAKKTEKWGEKSRRNGAKVFVIQTVLYILKNESLSKVTITCAFPRKNSRKLSICTFESCGGPLVFMLFAFDVTFRGGGIALDVCTSIMNHRQFRTI